MSNILMIIPDLSCGGGLQKIALSLVKELSFHHRVYFTSCDELVDNYDDIDFYKEQFIQQSSFNICSSTLEEFSRTINDNKIDIIIYHGFYIIESKFLQKWKEKNSTPILSVLHNTPETAISLSRNNFIDNTIKTKLKKLLFPLYKKYNYFQIRHIYRLNSSFSHKIILLSPNYIPVFREISGSTNVVAIPNFIKDSKRIPKIKRNRKLIYVGRLEERQKRVRRSIELWEKINRSKPDWTFELYGNGSCKEQYKNMICERDIVNVNLMGHSKKIEEVYESSDLILLVSDSEGLPMVLIEAMAKGCVPILYDTFLASHDFIHDGINGFLIKPYDKEAFLQKLEILMNNDEIFYRLSKEAQKVLDIYTNNKVVPMWNRIIYDTINQK